jgi:PKD repeat protein
MRFYLAFAVCVLLFASSVLGADGYTSWSAVFSFTTAGDVEPPPPPEPPPPEPPPPEPPPPEPAPVAAFSGTPVSGDVPLTVRFTDSSTGEITSRDWDFGDGEISMDTNPVHTYTNRGNYTVSLFVLGPGGDSTETRVRYIRVKKGNRGRR